MTETDSRPHNRALVASFLFTDLVGYSKGTAAEQYAAKASLSEILSRNMAALRKDDYRIKDTGDGALIAFLSSPEHALYVALAITEEFSRMAHSSGHLPNRLRTGLHIGAVKEAIDLEERPNYVGDGINAAKRIMDFATPGQITASRAYFEAVSWLDADYAALFRHLGAPDDKHGRAHELYAIVPDSAVLERLRQDLLPSIQERDEVNGKVGARMGANDRSTPAASPTSSGSKEGASRGMRKWVALPAGLIVAATVLSIYLGARSLDSSTLTARRAGRDASPPTSRTVTPSAEASVAAPANDSTLPAGPPAAATAAIVPSASVDPSVPSSSGRGDVGASIPVPVHTESTTGPARALPNLPSGSSLSRGDAKRQAAAPSAAGRAAPTGQRDARCQLIVEKATLGEPLSQDEKRVLATSCR